MERPFSPLFPPQERHGGSTLALPRRDTPHTAPSRHASAIAHPCTQHRVFNSKSHFYFPRWALGRHLKQVAKCFNTRCGCRCLGRAHHLKTNHLVQRIQSKTRKVRRPPMQQLPSTLSALLLGDPPLPLHYA